MKELTDRLETKIDKLDERLDSIDKTLIMQHAELAEHIRRTEAAETAILTIREELKPVLSSYEIAKICFKFFLSLCGLLLSAGGISLITEAVKKLS